MTLQIRYLAGALLAAVASVSLAGQTTVSVAWPENSTSRSARQSLMRSGALEALVDIADRHTTLRGDLFVVVDDSPESGFDPATNTIVLSYGHWRSAMARAAAVGRKSDIGSSSQLIDDAFLYAGVYQLARALMAQQDPATQLLGTDAVADLANVMLLELVPGGARIAQSAMYLYDDSIAVSGEDQYWRDHGHSIERVWSSTCHESADADAESRTVCADNYAQMLVSWAPLFESEQAERMLQTAKRSVEP